MPTESGFSQAELNKFTAAGRTIAAAVGTSVELWARAEMGVILKTWAGRTKVADPQKLTRRGLLDAYYRARYTIGVLRSNKGATRSGQASINLGERGPFGKVYYRTRKAGAVGGRRGFQDVYGPNFSKGKHIAPFDWGPVNYMVEKFRSTYLESMMRFSRAAGLSRQAIVQIADSLGIRLETVKGGRLSAAGLAKARRAIASDGRAYVNGFGRQEHAGARYSIEAILRYPLAQKIGMGITLAQVIRGRLQYFQKNLEHGTFLSAQRAARAYPYLAVLKAAA